MGLFLSFLIQMISFENMCCLDSVPVLPRLRRDVVACILLPLACLRTCPNSPIYVMHVLAYGWMHAGMDREMELSQKGPHSRSIHSMSSK